MKTNLKLDVRVSPAINVSPLQITFFAWNQNGSRRYKKAMPNNSVRERSGFNHHHIHSPTETQVLDPRKISLFRTFNARAHGLQWGGFSSLYSFWETQTLTYFFIQGLRLKHHQRWRSLLHGSVHESTWLNQDGGELLHKAHFYNMINYYFGSLRESVPHRAKLDKMAKIKVC